MYTVECIFLSQQATNLHEASRETVRRFINARSISEIVFTRGTTESINLVASSFADSQMKEGDEVIVSVMEHHSQYCFLGSFRQHGKESY